MFTIVAQTDKLNLINPLKTSPGFHLINERQHLLAPGERGTRQLRGVSVLRRVPRRSATNNLRELKNCQTCMWLYGPLRCYCNYVKPFIWAAEQMPLVAQEGETQRSKASDCIAEFYARIPQIEPRVQRTTRSFHIVLVIETLASFFFFVRQTLQGQMQSVNLLEYG